MTQALVTGCAGFVGSHLTDALLASGLRVRGVDAFTDYYDPARKRRNIAGALASERFELVEADLCTTDVVELLDSVEVVFHLAGQPGVRVSWSDGFRTVARPISGPRRGGQTGDNYHGSASQRRGGGWE